ncbi:MAG: hydrolase [Solirubrobacterales bacterium]|jgi:pimeloyl-ACP methyl ester carboxylesterase|nr:hydrolase [Solirubrobacterales bacterium]
MERSPLVLVHGFSGVPAMWEPVVPLLAERHELLLPVVAGHCGGAELAEGVQAGVAALVDDLEAQMDAAGMETAHVCGNSLGGWLALELAVRGRARSVVALSPAGGWEASSAEELRLRAYFTRVHRLLRFAGPRAETFARRPGLRKLALRDICTHPERYTARQALEIMRGSYDCPIFLDLMEGILRDGPPRAFEGIDCPVRLVWGTKDRVLPHARYTRRLRDLIGDAEYLELEGLGHCPMVDDPELVARTILEVTAAPAREPARA